MDVDLGHLLLAWGPFLVVLLVGIVYCWVLGFKALLTEGR